MPVLVTRRHTDKPTKDSHGLQAVAEWDVVATSTTNALTVLASAESVTLGTAFVATDGSTPSSTCLLRSFEPEVIAPAPTGGTGLYRIRAKYADQDEQKFRWPAIGGSEVWLWSVTTEFAPTQRDAQFRAITNSMGKAYSSAPSFPRAKVSVTYRKMIGTASLPDLPTRIDRSSSVNSAAWNPGGFGSVDARVALCTSITTKQVQAGWHMHECHFDFKEETFDIYTLDLDDFDHPLDGHGRLITPDTPEDLTGGSGPPGSTLYPVNAGGKLIAMFLRWRKAKERDFNSWGL